MKEKKKQIENVLKKTNRFIASHKSLSLVLFMFIFMAGFAVATTLTDGTSTFTGDVDLGSNSLNASQVYFGNSSQFLNQSLERALVSTESSSVSVCSSGCDYTQIQDALNKVPLILRHQYIINIQAGNYPENLWIPPIISGDIISTTEGSIEPLVIQGVTTDMTAVTVASIHISSGLGARTPVIKYLTVNESDPYSDEDTAIAVYGTQSAGLNNISFAGGTANRGIMAYGSNLVVSNIQLGSNDLVNGLQVKDDGSITSIDGGVFGSVTGYVYMLNGGFVNTKNDSATGGSGYAFTGSSGPSTGFLIKGEGTDDSTAYGLNRFFSAIRNLTIDTGSNGDYPFFITRSGSKSEAVSMWVDDENLEILVNQDENTGDSGSIEIALDDDGSSVPYLLIEGKSGNDMLRIKRGQGITIGSGSTQENITMTSPDGTEYTCGVANGGAFSCT